MKSQVKQFIHARKTTVYGGSLGRKTYPKFRKAQAEAMKRVRKEFGRKKTFAGYQR